MMIKINYKLSAILVAILLVITCDGNKNNKENLPLKQVNILKQRENIPHKLRYKTGFDSICYEINLQEYLDKPAGIRQSIYTIKDSSEIKTISIKKFTGRNLIAYVYENGDRNNDTLEIYNDTVVFNHNFIEIEDIRKFNFNNEKILVSTGTYTWVNSIEDLFITKEYGLVGYRFSTLTSTGFIRYDTNLSELQNQITADSIFSRIKYE